jgi:nucleoside-diphosphate-sugar epimerase
MAKIFITGATGQVGRHVAEYIVKKKLLGIESPKDVYCLVRNHKKANHLEDMDVTIIEGNLQDSDTISQVINNEGIEYVFHIAANTMIDATYDDLYKSNVLGTRIILDAFAKSEKGKCFIYTSSISVYNTYLGKEDHMSIDEETPFGPLEEGDNYAITKRIAEGIVQYYHEAYPEKNFITTRLGPIIGAGDRQFIPAMTKLMSYRFLPKLINGGRDLVSLTSPYDVARAQVFLAKRCEALNGEAFNVAKEPVTYRKMMNTIADYYHRKHPKLSIKNWFYKLIIPLLRFLSKVFPKMELLQIATNPTASNYIGKSFIYSSKKLEDQGFEYTIDSEEAIMEALTFLDPEKKIVKKGKRSKHSNKQGKNNN